MKMLASSHEKPYRYTPRREVQSHPKNVSVQGIKEENETSRERGEAKWRDVAMTYTIDVPETIRWIQQSCVHP